MWWRYQLGSAQSICGNSVVLYQVPRILFLCFAGRGALRPICPHIYLAEPFFISGSRPNDLEWASIGIVHASQNSLGPFYTNLKAVLSCRNGVGSTSELSP